MHVGRNKGCVKHLRLSHEPEDRRANEDSGQQLSEDRCLAYPLHPLAPECVNDFETQSARIYCRTSTVSRGVTGTSGMRWVGAALDAGGLIQTAFGTGGGAGGRRTNRSGWAV
jgi:hypothetical protein